MYIDSNKQNKSKLCKMINNAIGKNKMTMSKNRFKYNGGILNNKQDIVNYLDKVSEKLNQTQPTKFQIQTNPIKLALSIFVLFPPVVAKG